MNISTARHIAQSATAFTLALFVTFGMLGAVNHLAQPLTDADSATQLAHNAVKASKAERS